jgi:hypothetical protein
MKPATKPERMDQDAHRLHMMVRRVRQSDRKSDVRYYSPRKSHDNARENTRRLRQWSKRPGSVPDTDRLAPSEKS